MPPNLELVRDDFSTNILPLDFYKMDLTKFSPTDEFEAIKTSDNGNCFYDSIYKATNGEKKAPCTV